jgi:hypothetical protein
MIQYNHQFFWSSLDSVSAKFEAESKFGYSMEKSSVRIWRNIFSESVFGVEFRYNIKAPGTLGFRSHTHFSYRLNNTEYLRVKLFIFT